MGEFFAFKLNKLKIINNREIFGKGEIKILSFLTGSDVGLPLLDGYQETNDDDAKKELIKAATTSVLSAKQLIQIDNITDGHQVFFGDTGYSLYTSTTKIPISFNWSLLVFESDSLDYS